MRDRHQGGGDLDLKQLVRAEELMARAVACLMCRHFAPRAPPDWKPKYERAIYDVYDIRKKMRAPGGKHELGLCRLYPISHEVWTSHYCGKFQAADHGLVTVESFVWPDWNSQELEKTKEKLKEAQRLLKLSREKSQNRLRRIQTLLGDETNKEKTESPK